MSLAAASALLPQAGAAAAPSAMESMGAMSKELQNQQAKSQPAPLPSAGLQPMPGMQLDQPYRPYRSGGYGV